MMVHINGFFGWVKIVLLKTKNIFFWPVIMASRSGPMGTTSTFANPRPSKLISTLTLVGSCRSAPQETIRKSQFFGHNSTHFLICLFIYLYYNLFCKPFLIKYCDILILFYYLSLSDCFLKNYPLEKVNSLPWNKKEDWKLVSSVPFKSMPW